MLLFVAAYLLLTVQRSAETSRATSLYIEIIDASTSEMMTIYSCTVLLYMLYV